MEAGALPQRQFVASMVASSMTELLTSISRATHLQGVVEVAVAVAEAAPQGGGMIEETIENGVVPQARVRALLLAVVVGAAVALMSADASDRLLHAAKTDTMLTGAMEPSS